MKLITESVPVSHEDLFIERYAKLSLWALQMTGNDRELAEDLVQDAFIQFTFTRPDLPNVHNLDGYLYAMLRNLHMSQVRKSARARLQPFSIVEYESAEMSLRAADARDQIRAQDELRQICHFACVRKESAWVGSVLILRFFHGYYPSEIAQVLRTSRASVDQRLMLARSEARVSLTNPTALSFMKERVTVPFGQTGFAREASEFLIELRQMIFHSRQGRCLSHKQLQTLYAGNELIQMKNEELAHVVSCPRCLDIVNKLLGLPLLAERYPTDTIGRDQRGKGGRGGGSGEGPSGDASIGAIRRWRRRAREAFEHRPKELHISVNGLLQGSQKINSQLSEQTLDVDMTEEIGFVEVFSELGIRLLLLNVDEPPPRGQVEQTTRVELSDRRTLELKLRFDSPWPTLHVAYADPLMRPDAAAQPASDASLECADSSALSKAATSRRTPKRSAPRQIMTSLRDWSFWPDWRFWIRPATVTALVAVIAIAALVLTWLHGPVRPLSVAELLQQSIQQEDALAARADQVLHRTINLEERRVAQTSVCDGCSGELISRRKIEIWQSAEKGITARRLYDDRGVLIAGDWLTAAGVQTLYHHGSQPKVQIRNPQFAIRNSEVWQLDPSAKDFASLIVSNERAHVEERENSYVIRYEGEDGSQSRKGDTSSEPRTGRNVIAQGVSPGSTGPTTTEPSRGDRASSPSALLVRATLTLSKADLRAIELVLLVPSEATNGVRVTTDQGLESNRQSAIGNRQWVEYRFVEASFERRAPSTVAPKVFEPEPELMSGPETRNSKPETAAPALTSDLRPLTSGVTASAGLEVEVLRQLDQAGALYGEQVSLARTPEGQLLVQGVVDSSKRKGEIRQALVSFLKNPAVRFEVETGEEAQQRQAREARRAAESSSASVSSVAVEQQRATPADGDLRAYFSGKGLSGPQLEQEVRRFSDRALAHARQARRHALALKQIVERFSAEDLSTMDESSRQQWRALVDQHARSIQQETESLRRELQPIFFPGEPQAGGGGGSTNDLAQAAKQLFEIAVSNDDTVRRSFTLGSSGSPAVKSSEFARSLSRAISLAAAISRQ